jgi:ubiquinone biosynthesis protein
MSVSLVPKKLKRYKDIAWLLVKYGRSDWARGMGADDELAPAVKGASTPPPEAEELAKDLEKLGPTFIKIGQLLSTRADLLPPPYLAALSRLQDKVEPFSFAEVESIVESELNVRLSKAFAEFESTPLAAASLGQVHRARLRDGRPVAIKVQRPGIREQVLEDLEAFTELARFLDQHSELAGRFELEKTVEEFRATLLEELDYRREARNLAAIGTNLSEFELIVVPDPILDYTTGRVLTMDYIRGSKVTSLSPLIRLDLDGATLAEELFRAYLKQILVDGFFHADPHPGNVFITDDGRIALLDLGMVARLSGRMQEELLKLLLAVAEGDGDEAAERAEQIGQKQEGFETREFRRRIANLVGTYHHATVGQMQIGKIILEVSRVAGDSGMRLPSELTMLGKTLLNLDEVGRVLAPDFDPNASIRRNAADLLRRHMWKSASPGNLAATLLEAKEFVQKLPARVNRVLDLLAENDLRLQVDAIDEERLIEGLHKIANRIALGLVLAALIVGAALLMQVPTTFRILGYPGLAMIFFLAAAAGGFALVVGILVNDRKKPRGKPPSSGV